MIALCENVLQVVELRRFLLDLDEIANVVHDKETYWGNKITKKERKKWEKKLKKF